jgi:multiple sugar transport system ATP-binding protein
MVLKNANLELPLPDSLRAAVESDGGKELTAGIRPEHFEVIEGTPPGPGATIRATTDVVEFLGNEELLHVNVGEHDLVAIVDAARRIRPGDVLDLWVPLEKIHLFEVEEGRALTRAVA